MRIRPWRRKKERKKKKIALSDQILLCIEIIVLFVSLDKSNLFNHVNSEIIAIVCTL